MIKKALVGYTGFVGQNLWAHGDFDAGYNSKNIKDAYGSAPKLLVYAGVRAEKFLANTAPERDLLVVEEAFENIKKISPERLVLISTIDVFKEPSLKDENSPIETEGLNAYGKNRYKLELMVRDEYPDAVIVRLPALFGKGLKKNFIFDFMTFIPSMLKESKLNELKEKEPILSDYYEDQGNGFYKLKVISDIERDNLKGAFKRVGFSALNFTDARSRYQFYPLSRLSADLDRVLSEGIGLFHPATEPVSAGEVYSHLTGDTFANELPGTPADYDYRTVYADLFNGRDGYIMDRMQVLSAVRDYVNQSAV